MPARSWGRRLLWFAALWAAGVLTLLAISAILRLVVPG